MISEGRNDDIQSCIEMLACLPTLKPTVFRPSHQWIRTVRTLHFELDCWTGRPIKDILPHAYISTHDCISSFRAGNHFLVIKSISVINIAPFQMDKKFYAMMFFLNGLSQKQSQIY